MKMKIEVGMYVRTERGRIWLVTSTKAIDGHKRRIVKASYNIVDLVQVGDYVNGYKVRQDEEGKLYYHKIIGYDLLEKCEIKSIVTKEQFEQMQYKVGD
jgi:hypothetical protein